MVFHFPMQYFRQIFLTFSYTRTVKLKLWILEFRVAWILGHYATGRLKLCHTHTAETEVSKSPSCPVQRTSGNEFSEFPKMYQSVSLCQVIQVVTTTWLFLTREKQENFSYTPTLRISILGYLLQSKNCGNVIRNSSHYTE